MEDQAQLLTRIAEALERLAPAATQPCDWMSAPAYIWDITGARPISHLDAPDLDLLRGIEKQKAAVVENIARLASGYGAHDMLLWGSRGMGKSALLRAATRNAQANGGAIALVQIATDTLHSLPQLFAELSAQKRNFCVFIDDLGFADGDTSSPRHLRSWLDGGVEARPANVRIGVTSNRRAILARHTDEQDDPINPRDAVDDNLALSDRFGLSLGFHNASQDDYLEMVEGYATTYGLSFAAEDALEWARRRGARSGRIAWHFITELAGREGKQI